MKNIILASQSPRRKELLAQAGFSFEIITSDVEEIITHTKPWEIAESLSSQKAEDVFNKVIDKYGEDKADNYLVIGADTIFTYPSRSTLPPTKETGVTETRLLTIGIPYFFSILLPVSTKCSARVVILS